MTAVFTAPVLPPVAGSTRSWLDAAPTQLRRDGYPVEDAAVERLSPLIHDRISLLGRYHLTNT